MAETLISRPVGADRGEHDETTSGMRFAAAGNQMLCGEAF